MDSVAVIDHKRSRQAPLTLEALTLELADEDAAIVPRYSEFWDKEAEEWVKVYDSERKEEIDALMRRIGYRDETKEFRLNVSTPRWLPGYGSAVWINNIARGSKYNEHVGNVIHVNGVHIRATVYARAPWDTYECNSGAYWQLLLVYLPGELTTYPEWDTYHVTPVHADDNRLMAHMNEIFEHTVGDEPAAVGAFSFPKPEYEDRFHQLWKKHGVHCFQLSGGTSYVLKKQSCEDEGYWRQMTVEVSIPVDVKTVYADVPDTAFACSGALYLVGAGQSVWPAYGGYPSKLWVREYDMEIYAIRTMFQGEISVTYTDE